MSERGSARKDTVAALGTICWFFAVAWFFLFPRDTLLFSASGVEKYCWRGRSPRTASHAVRVALAQVCLRGGPAHGARARPEAPPRKERHVGAACSQWGTAFNERTSIGPAQRGSPLTRLGLCVDGALVPAAARRPRAHGHDGPWILRTDGRTRSRDPSPRASFAPPSTADRRERPPSRVAPLLLPSTDRPCVADHEVTGLVATLEDSKVIAPALLSTCRRTAAGHTPRGTLCSLIRILREIQSHSGGGVASGAA